MKNRQEKLLTTLQFEFDLEKTKLLTSWRIGFLEYNKPEHMPNKRRFNDESDFLDHRKNMIEAINKMKPGDEIDEVEYGRIQALVSNLNRRIKATT